MNYNTIVIPVDFSELNHRSIVRGADIQRNCGAKIILAHVIDYAPPPYIKPQVPEIYASESIMMERATKELDILGEKENLDPFESVVKIGHTKESLLSLINEYDAELVIMAKHSQKGLERLLGSTTNSVVQKARCEVLVMPE